MAGKLHAADEVDGIWRETAPVDLAKTPICMANNTFTFEYEEGMTTQYGIWIAYSDGTIDFFDRDTWQVLYSVSDTTGADIKQMYDATSTMYVVDNSGYIWILDKNTMTWTSWSDTDENITAPIQMCENYMGGGTYLIGDSDGTIAGTDFEGGTGSNYYSTGATNSGGGMCIQAIPEDWPTLGYTACYWLNPTGHVYMIDVDNWGLVEDIILGYVTTKAGWAYNDSRFFFGDQDDNLCIMACLDGNTITQVDVGMQVDYLFRGEAEKLYFADATGRFGCYDVQSPALEYNDGKIVGTCCGIVVPADRNPA